MKAWVFAFGFGLAMLPTIANAGATPETRDCQTGAAQRGACIVSSAQPGGTPATTNTRPIARAPAPQPTRNDVARRRSGKHIPDAELIGPHGAL